MTVILGYEIADDYHEYRYGGGVEKLWECPRCKHDFVFCFHGDPPWPPLSLMCPDCGSESPIPWRKPPMVSWTCQICGHVQKTSSRCWKSPEKEYKVVFSDVHETSQELLCSRCFRSAKKDGRGVIDDIGDVFLSAGNVVDEFVDGIRQLFGWGNAAAQQAELERENQERAKRAKRAKRDFEGFLKKAPQLRAEQERLAEEKKQRAALEAKARQEELRLLKRQARTAVGLKRMKPTNFELAVASLYLKLGYEVYGTPTSGDRGIDLVAIKNKQRIAV